jgi:hypothetical protein
VGEQDVFDLGWSDVLTTPDDGVVAAALDEQVTAATASSAPKRSQGRAIGASRR